MRRHFETIVLVYHTTNTSKTVTTVIDARRFSKRTLFLAHPVELVDQSAKTFRELWPQAAVGRYVESAKEKDAFVVCGNIQSAALNLDQFKPDEFGYILADETYHAGAGRWQEHSGYLQKHRPQTGHSTGR